MLAKFVTLDVSLDKTCLIFLMSSYAFGTEKKQLSEL